MYVMYKEHWQTRTVQGSFAKYAELFLVRTAIPEPIKEKPLNILQRCQALV